MVNHFQTRTIFIWLNYCKKKQEEITAVALLHWIWYIATLRRLCRFTRGMLTTAKFGVNSRKINIIVDISGKMQEVLELQLGHFHHFISPYKNKDSVFRHLLRLFECAGCFRYFGLFQYREYIRWFIDTAPARYNPDVWIRHSPSKANQIREHGE